MTTQNDATYSATLYGFAQGAALCLWSVPQFASWILLLFVFGWGLLYATGYRPHRLFTMGWRPALWFGGAAGGHAGAYLLVGYLV